MPARRKRSSSPVPLAPMSADCERELTALREELATLRDGVAAFRAAILSVQQQLQSPSARDQVASPLDVIESSDQNELRQSDNANAATSRRNLLKWGGLGAAAALAAAGGAALSSQTAHAADGANLVLGQSNTAEHTTAVSYDGTETAPVALSASASNLAQGTGIAGQGGSGGFGVVGHAMGPASTGMLGTNLFSFAVEGKSVSGIDVFASGTGRILQALSGSVGAPTTGSHGIGEQIRDNQGNLFICISGGTPGTWKQVVTLDATAPGGAVGLLTTPIRLYDSRTAGGPFVGNTARTIQVTGVAVNGVEVPLQATGCIGNLTVTSTTAAGFLVIYPQGSATPSTSTVNFTSGQTAANSFTVGLGSTGQVTIHSFTSGQCQVILDITGFIA